jgi:hypothetical protein
VPASHRPHAGHETRPARRPPRVKSLWPAPARGRRAAPVRPSPWPRGPSRVCGRAKAAAGGPAHRAQFPAAYPARRQQAERPAGPARQGLAPGRPDRLRRDRLRRPRLAAHPTPALAPCQGKCRRGPSPPARGLRQRTRPRLRGRRPHPPRGCGGLRRAGPPCANRVIPAPPGRAARPAVRSWRRATPGEPAEVEDGDVTPAAPASAARTGLGPGALGALRQAGAVLLGTRAEAAGGPADGPVWFNRPAIQVTPGRSGVRVSQRNATH